MRELYEVALRVNDREVRGRVTPETSLLQFLREGGFIEVKQGCAKGDCGACTVIMDGRAILSCITPVLQAEGSEVYTVKSLGGWGELHPLQQAFVDHQAVQCGFCTPGMLMSARALLEANPRPTREEIREALSGNLCRCTGYRKIVDAVEEAAAAMRGAGPAAGRGGAGPVPGPGAAGPSAGKGGR